MRRIPCSLSCWLLVTALLAGSATVGFAASAKHGKKPSLVATAADAKKGPDTAGKAGSQDSKAKDAKPDAKPAAKDAADEAAAKPGPYRVKKGPFRIEVNLEGLFEAQNMTEVAIRPQEWIAFAVLKAVEHGTAVKRGDLLVQLDTDKIDRAIADLRTETQVADIAMKQAEQQLAALEKSAPLDADANERNHRMVQEDWKQYVEVEKPLAVRAADAMLESAKDMVEYQEEELRQLEKMYKADDLMEETEKIVLKRARDSVKRAKFNLERTQAACDEARKLTFPRYEEKMKDVTARAEIDWNRAKAVLPLALNKQRLELDKLKLLRAQSEDKLNKLLADREAMTIKSPADGIVYYGKCVRGKWAAGVSAADVLRRGSVVMPNDVFMTVVQPRPLVVHSTVPEAQLQHVHAGLQGTVEPAAFGNMKLPAILQRVSSVPITSGSFDALFTLAADGQADALMPGMACEIKLVPYKKPDALTVPPKAVFTEELDPLKQYVYVQGKDNKPEKRNVTLGKRNEKQVEVLQGLAEGDQVLLEKPKEAP
jgi:HlyD family secretion protein